MRDKEADGEIGAQVLEELRHLRGTSSELIAHLRSQAVNGVLEVATLTFDADGVIERSYHTMCGSVVIINANSTAVTVVSGGSSGTAPGAGRGVTIVPASSWLAIPIAAHTWTAYGTATAALSFQAFTGMQAYGIAR